MTSNQQQTIIVRLLPAELADSTFEDSPFCTCGFCTLERIRNPNRRQQQQQNISSFSNTSSQSSSSTLYPPTTTIHWDVITPTSLSSLNLHQQQQNHSSTTSTSSPSVPPPHDTIIASQRNLLLDLQIQAIHDHCFPLEYDDRFYNWCKFGLNHVILLAMQRSGIVDSDLIDEDKKKELRRRWEEEERMKSEREDEDSRSFSRRLENLLSGVQKEDNHHHHNQQQNISERMDGLVNMSPPDHLATTNRFDVFKFLREQRGVYRRFLPPKTGLKMVRPHYVDEFDGKTKYDSGVNEVIGSALAIDNDQNVNNDDRNDNNEKISKNNSKNNNNNNNNKSNSLINSSSTFYASRISPCLSGFDQIQGIAVSRIVPPTKSSPLIAPVLAGRQSVTPSLPNREALGALCYIATLGVREDSRGKGLATELIRRTLEECSGNFSGNVCDAPWMKEKKKKMNIIEHINDDDDNSHANNINNNNNNNNHRVSMTASSQRQQTIINRADSCLFRCNRLFLHCLDTNVSALKLYANLGFEATDVLRNYYFLEGTWRDGIVLTRPILPKVVLAVNKNNKDNNSSSPSSFLTGDSPYDLTGEEEDDENLRRMAKGEVIGDGPPNLLGGGVGVGDQQPKELQHWSVEMMRVAALLTPAAVAAAMMF